MGERLTDRVLLIGWDAADWKLIRPLLAKGWMPNLQGLMAAGVWGNLATLEPILSPMLWTSIATGKRPVKHGIHGFTEPHPSGEGVRAVTSTSRKCKAIWNILSQNSMRSNVVGWFASHPAEPIKGVAISNEYHRSIAPLDKPWPMGDGVVYPDDLRQTLADFRVHPQMLDQTQLQPFIAKIAEIDQDKDRRMGVLAKLLAECATIHAAGTYLMEHHPWDLCAIYYDAIDHFSHAFMQYHPPKMDKVKQEDFEIYQDVVVGCYRFHDMMLGRLLELAGDESTVMLISDHGFHSDHLRPRMMPRMPAGPATWHRPYGIFCMKGPGIKRNEQIYGASLLDVAPTILALLGLAPALDMDGRVLRQVFVEPVQADPLPSWEIVAGDCGMHDAQGEDDPQETAEAIKQLVALGYIDEPDENKQKAAQNAAREGRYNLAYSLMDSNDYAQAAEHLEQLREQFPQDVRLTLQLARCRYLTKDLPGCRQLVEPIIEKGKDRPLAHLLLGALALAEDSHEQALDHLLQGEKVEPRFSGLHVLIGQAYLKLQRWEDAERSFRRALEIDGDSAKAYDGLAASLLRQQRYEEAADAALTAVGLLHHLAEAHFHLGVALANLGRPQDAINAFNMCLSICPEAVEAHRWLAEIYANSVNDPEKAGFHRRQSREIGMQRAMRQVASKLDSPFAVEKIDGDESAGDRQGESAGR